MKVDAIFVKLDAPVSFVVFLGMLYYYGECPCMDELSPVTLIGRCDRTAIIARSLCRGEEAIFLKKY